MCLAIPMKVTTVRPDGSGTVELNGTAQQVQLLMVTDPRPGDYVIVHAGFALEKLDLREAQERLDLFREMADAWHRQEEGGIPAETGPQTEKLL